MKIVIVGTAHPYRGGLAAYNERLAKQLYDEGHNVSVITFSLQYPSILFPGKTQFTTAPVPDGFRITRLLNSINPFNWILTGRKIRKANPDIILIKYWHPFMAPCLGTVARVAKRIKNHRPKVICIFDNVIPHEKKPGDRFLTGYFTRSIDGAIVMSESVKEDLKTFRVNIPVIFNPHPLYDNYGDVAERNAAASRLGLSPDDSFLLFFGFIRAYKGLDLLLEAFGDKRFRNRGLKLIIAGEFYENDTRYKQIISRMGIKNDVIMFDRFIAEDEVALFFSVADLVVQPYRSATQSGVTQIAYHFGKPMVVTDVGGLSEIVPDGKCGYVVKPEPDQIAQAVDDYFTNNRMEQFRRGVMEEKAKFTWDKLTASIMQIYNDSNQKQCLTGVSPAGRSQ